MNSINAKDLTLKTIHHYDGNPLGFWEGTKDHDVSQNINALLANIKSSPPFKILDFGCGPGRDLKKFRDLGHDAYGLDGCAEFCKMANQYSGSPIFHQNFLELDLPLNFFDGIFANASLFHVPKSHLTNVISKLRKSLKPDGILFSSNPRGSGEDFSGSRYANFMEIDAYKKIVEEVGFKLIDHYYRPQGLPIENCPWLASVFVSSQC